MAKMRQNAKAFENIEICSTPTRWHESTHGVWVRLKS